MSHRRWTLRIQDIIDAAKQIAEFIEGMNSAQFEQDARTIKAVIANFTIIGEAASHVPDEITSIYPDIPWRTMKEMRNVMVHVYFAVKLTTIWDTARNDVPKLIPPLERLLREQPPESTG